MAGDDARQPGPVADADLATLSRQALAEEVVRLRDGIRAHRDSAEHELCWHHPELWSLLPERSDPLPAVPEWPQFLRGCVRYRQSLDEQLPGAPRVAVEHDPSRDGRVADVDGSRHPLRGERGPGSTT